MEKLKPCPFCGGEADCISEDAGWDSRGENIWAVTVGCLSCGANIEVERRCDHLMRDDDIEGETCHALEEEVAAMWNARAIDRDELWEVVESLEKPWPLDKGKHGTIPLEDAQLFEREMASRIRKAVGE